MFVELPYDLRRTICDLAIDRELYRKFVKYLEFKQENCTRTYEKELDRFNVLLEESIGQNLLRETFCYDPPCMVNRHIYFQDRPYYYQERICAFWKLYTQFCIKNEHLKDVLIQLVSNICYDYIQYFPCYFMSYETLCEDPCLYESIYQFVSKRLQMIRMLSNLYSSEQYYYRLDFYYHVVFENNE